jgi:hypothetical protein
MALRQAMAISMRSRLISSPDNFPGNFPGNFFGNFVSLADDDLDTRILY